MTPKFIMLVGLPGSGKSTLGEKIAEEINANIHSSDSIREELSGDINNQNINQDVFNLLHKRIKEDLIKGNNCIYDATNISYKRRKAFLDELHNIRCNKICIVVATPYEICLKQNEKRERKVPQDVIKKMYMNFDIPYYYEGWDIITLKYINPTYETLYKDYNKFIEDTYLFDQQNKYHNNTLGDHCFKTRQYIDKYFESRTNLTFTKDVLHIAASLHDCGKPFCKTFKNYKDEIDTNAHYYNHEHVGSYNCLFYDLNENILANKLDIAILIRWHMQMHYIKKQPQTEEKYRKLLSKIYNDLLFLNEADTLGH